MLQRIVLTLNLFVFNCFASVAPEQIVDYKVFQIESGDAVEPSGLVIKGGVLYTVSDDHNNIYKINFQGDSAILEVEHALDSMQLSVLNFDLEGITLVDDEFFLVSEMHHKLIRLNSDSINWVPDFGSVYPEASKAGLFKTKGAGIEALTYMGGFTFLLAVERQPRGLIEVTFNADFSSIVNQINQVSIKSEHEMKGVGNADLTGLYTHRGVTYALYRNAYLVHELIKDESGRYIEGKSWSFENLAHHPDYAYEDMSYGQAEGLAVDDNYFYIVFDNNGLHKQNNAEDKRPILIRINRK